MFKPGDKIEWRGPYGATDKGVVLTLQEQIVFLRNYDAPFHPDSEVIARWSNNRIQVADIKGCVLLTPKKQRNIPEWMYNVK